MKMVMLLTFTRRMRISTMVMLLLKRIVITEMLD